MQYWKHNFRGARLVAAVTVASSQAFLLPGFHQGVMAGIIGADNRFGGEFPSPVLEMQGNITSLYNIGSFINSIATYSIGERRGRRTMLINGR